MPNHVLTEIVFSGVDDRAQSAVLSLVSSPKALVDFEVLLPIPANVWLGNSGRIHTKTFPATALDWCASNWSTKWGAYGIDEGGRYQTVARAADTLTITFKTAWRPPYGWLLALWHKAAKPLSYTYLDEGAGSARFGRFTTYDEPWGKEPWTEGDCTPEETRRMHKLLWGVESFDDEAS